MLLILLVHFKKWNKKFLLSSIKNIRSLVLILKFSYKLLHAYSLKKTPKNKENNNNKGIMVQVIHNIVTGNHKILINLHF